MKNLPASHKKKVKLNAIKIMQNGSELNNKMNLDLIIGINLVAEVKL
jgi:hypothetical protein